MAFQDSQCPLVHFLRTYGDIQERIVADCYKVIEMPECPVRDVVGVPPDNHRLQQAANSVCKLIVSKDMARSRFQGPIFALAAPKLLQRFPTDYLHLRIPHSPRGEPQVSTSEINSLISKVSDQAGQVDELVGFFDSQVDPDCVRTRLNEEQPSALASQLLGGGERTHHFVVRGDEHFVGTAES